MRKQARLGPALLSANVCGKVQHMDTLGPQQLPAGQGTPMRQEPAVVPATQLELDELHEEHGSQHAGHYLTDFLPSESPVPREDTEPDQDDDPPSHSSTPSLDLTELAQWSKEPCAPAPQHQHTWSQYQGCLFDLDTPIEGQLSGLLLGDRFRMGSIIGRGSFGFTYKAVDTMHDSEVAVKTAKGCHAHNHHTHYSYDDFLKVEWDAYSRIQAAEPTVSTGTPAMLAAGIHNFAPDFDDDRPVFKVSFMAMELLGPSCWGAVNSMHLPQDTFQDSEAWIDDGLDSQPVHEPLRMPSTEWIVKTGKGMLKALADVHRRGFIHRDVKTENFCLDAAGSNDTIKIIDFGFARMAYGYYSFRSDYDKHCASFWGTPNYAALSALMSLPQTPRDDLECLVYCLFEMEQPTLRLPWNHTLTTNAEAKEGWSMKQLERMSKKKKKAWLEACKQGVVPEYLMGFHDYITSLSPKQIPDYEWLMMQLDSGVTGQSPGRQPLRCQLADWPSPGDLYSRQDYALYAISKVRAAASRILPLSRTTCLQPGTSPVGVLRGRSKRTFAEFADAEAMSDGAQQKRRQESFAWPSAEFSDEEEVNSQAASSPACVGAELLQLGGKFQQVCAPASTAQHTTSSSFLLGESQTDAEE